MTTLRRLLFAGTATLALSACAAGPGFVSVPENLAAYGDASRALAAAESATASGPFFTTLREAYLGYARYEFERMRDFRDAAFFAGRAAMAARGEMPEPQAVGDRAIPVAAQADLGSAWARLTAVLQGGGPEKAPEATARALAAYECWLEQQEEDFQPEDIAACRRTFEENIALAQQALKPQVPAVITIQAEVLFDFDSAVLRDEAKARLDEIAELLKANPEVRVYVDGHADTVGPKAYNRRLSLRRAQAVADDLAARGVAPERMEVRGFGEERLAVPTPDETPEPRNRRVEIRRRD